MRAVVSILWAILCAAASACGSTDGAGPLAAATACNGADALCARRYDEVAFPGTHDSVSTREEHFGAPDQTHVIATQLVDGIRVLHLESFHTPDGDFVCHGLCQIGERPLVDVLTNVRAFLDASPREVVTLLLEANGGLTADGFAAAFSQSGLLRYVHPQRLADPWPTLGDLIAKGERLVAFLDDGGADGVAPYPWLLARWDYTEETPWETDEPADFSCEIDRGTLGAPLYTVDQFLDSPVKDIIPTPERAALVNTSPFVDERLARCRREAGRIPNFVLYDYYEVGDSLRAVRVLNGLEAEPAGVVLDGGGVTPVDEGVDAGPDDGADRE